jgi:CRISPR-associated exonuclease Cas4
MITVSLILEYLYCPYKVIMKIQDNDLDNISIIKSRISRDALIGFEELIKRNLWSLKGEMDVKKILEELLKDVPAYLEIVYQQYQDEEVDNADITFERLKEDLKFNSWLIAIKSQKMLKTGINGAEAVNLLFPTSLIEFRIEDKETGLLGEIDKIEIVDGVYYPVKIKTNLPPLKGVWRSDAIQITAYAYLIEQEFNKEVPVGFINYMRVGSRKPVLINTNLREQFSQVFNEIVAIVNKDSVPDIAQNIRKCHACDYSEICEFDKGK